MAKQCVLIKRIPLWSMKIASQMPKLITTIRKTQGLLIGLGVAQPSGLQWHLLDCLSCPTGMLWALIIQPVTWHARSYCLIMFSSNYDLQQIRTSLSKNRALLFGWGASKLTAEQTPKTTQGLMGAIPPIWFGRLCWSQIRKIQTPSYPETEFALMPLRDGEAGMSF